MVVTACAMYVAVFQFSWISFADAFNVACEKQIHASHRVVEI